jgi:hypothetical protein
MKILCLQDGDYANSISEDLFGKLENAAGKEGHLLEAISLRRGDLSFCRGCLRCWTSESGVCIYKDRIPEICTKLSGSGLLIFISPVLFGTYSSTMKTLVDKGVGSNSFEEIHYPQLIIGYGEALRAEEISCFRDITMKHRGPADIVHPEISDFHIDVMITGSVEENTAVCKAFERQYLSGEAVL